MPAGRPLNTRLRASGRPHEPPIVISSDEGEEPVPVPTRGSQRPRRPRGEGGALTVAKTLKAKELELEGLRQRCRQLEQASSPGCMGPVKAIRLVSTS
jgi:hypothetical protein